MDGKAQSRELKKDTPQTIIFYYTADPQDNIKLQYINAKTNEKLGDAKAAIAGHTGETLYLNAGAATVKDNMPAGYHYASSTELHGHSQITSVVYKTTGQTVDIYVAGDNAATGDEVTVKHYLQGTTTNVPGMTDYPLGGQYGDTVSASGSDSQQTATPGYTIVDGKLQSRELKKDTPQTIIFYYTADTQSNVKVTYVNAKNGATVGNVYKPTGGTGTSIDLRGGIPDGYHYASGTELHGKTQPDANIAKYTIHKQDFTVYVACHLLHLPTV